MAVPLPRLAPWATHARAIASVGVLAMAGCLVFAARTGIHPPEIHDEFSYLLGADTFLLGRLTNPAPAEWKHFEAPHVIVQPSYTSKYPPGQALFLAAGRLLTGVPMAGVWLGTSLACAAIVWMLLAWVPPVWAWAGGLVAIARFVFLGDDGWWSQRLWGGGVALLGGALVFGAWRRLAELARPRDALWLALGLWLLANTRPFEGMVVSLPVLAHLLWRARQPARTDLRGWGVVLALAIPLCAGGLWMARYNQQVTGHFWRLPHLVYQEQWTAAPQFLWLSPGPTPTYDNKEMENLHLRELNKYRQLRHPRVWLADLADRWSSLWRFFLGVPFALALLALPLRNQNDWSLRALGVVVWLLAALSSLTWFFPHYAAPAGALFVLLIVEGLRGWSSLRVRGSRVGSWVVTAVALACVVQIVTMLARARPDTGFGARREAITSRLEAQQGGHLILVEYARWHPPYEEWVYNGADLESERVLWARDLGREADRALIEAYPGRTVWQLMADAPSPEPRRYLQTK